MRTNRLKSHADVFLQKLLAFRATWYAPGGRADRLRRRGGKAGTESGVGRRDSRRDDDHGWTAAVHSEVASRGTPTHDIAMGPHTLT